MKMASMKMAPGESEHSMISQPMNPEYPYGLRLCLKENSIAKLGIEALPKIDTEMMVMAKVKVVEVCEEMCEGEGIERELELQIVEMALEPVKSEKQVATKLYK